MTEKTYRYVHQGFSIVFGLLFMTSTGGGCCTTNGLVKTPLGQRVTTSFPQLGIRMDVPRQPRNVCEQYWIDRGDTAKYRKFSNTKGDFVLMMHTVWAGTFVEPQRLLNFWVVRLAPGQFKAFVAGEHYLCGDVPFGNSPEPYHDDIRIRSAQKVHDWRQWLCFRRDVKLPNGDIVLVGAWLLNNEGAIPNKDDDVKAIKEILNSVRPLDQPSTKN